MPISRKVSEQIGRASWIRRMFEEGRALKARVGEANVYDFSLGNPIVEPPPEFFEALESVLGDHAPGLHRYMTNAGFEDTRRAVADRHSLESGLPYTSDHIVMSVGSAGALNTTLKAIVNAGEEVVLLAPFFAEYEFYIDNHGGVPKIVPTTAEFDPDIVALDAAIGPQTRALILNSPNNPTGRVYGHSVVDEVARLLERKQKQFGTVIYLLSDEPYRALVYDDIDQPVIATYYANSIVCTSHSKDLGLPGERIGHIAVSPDCADAGELVNGMAFAIRTLGFVNAPAIMQRVITSLLDCSVDVDFYRRNRDTLYTELRGFGFEMQRPQGAFFLFPKTPIPDDIAFVRGLQKHHILTVPGSGFGTPGYIRISYSVERDMLERSLPVWEQAARELGLQPKAQASS
jgi:aspartate aminotransferase